MDDVFKRFLNRTGLRGPASFARRALRHPVTIRHEFEFLRDYWAFRRHFGCLAEGPRRRDTTNTVLVFCLTDWLAQVKTAMVLAKALQVSGYAPVILTRARFQRALRYYHVFGFDALVFFDEYVEEDVPPEAVRTINELLAHPTTFRTIKRFRYQEIQVGQQALVTLMRRLHQGTLDLGAPAITAQLKQLMLEGVRTVDATNAMLDDVRPALALANDAMYIGTGTIFEGTLARGIPVIQWVGCQRDDALALKRFDRRTLGVHPFSLSEATWEAVRGQPWTLRRERELTRDFHERYVEGRWSSYYNRPYGAVVGPDEVRRRLGLDPRKKTAVIFPHLLWDPTMFWGEDLFETYEEWLVETVRAACGNPNVNWVVRFHPANLWKLKLERLGNIPLERTVIRDKLGTLPGHIACLEEGSDISTFALFGVADACITVRGTIGIEMAAFGIPVLTAGTGRYSGRGFTVDSSSRAEYLARLGAIQDMPRLTSEQTALAKQYAHALFVRRPARFHTFQVVFRSLAEATHPFCNNVVIRARSFQEFAEADDLRAFAEWATCSRASDFLAPEANGHEAAG